MEKDEELRQFYANEKIRLAHVSLQRALHEIFTCDSYRAIGLKVKKYLFEKNLAS